MSEREPFMLYVPRRVIQSRTRPSDAAPCPASDAPEPELQLQPQPSPAQPSIMSSGLGPRRPKPWRVDPPCQYSSAHSVQLRTYGDKVKKAKTKGTYVREVRVGAVQKLQLHPSAAASCGAALAPSRARRGTSSCCYYNSDMWGSGPHSWITPSCTRTAAYGVPLARAEA
jgi:hypothetical protein